MKCAGGSIVWHPSPPVKTDSACSLQSISEYAVKVCGSWNRSVAGSNLIRSVAFVEGGGEVIAANVWSSLCLDIFLPCTVELEAPCSGDGGEKEASDDGGNLHP